MNKIKILVVPHWVEIALRAGGGNIGSLLQPDKIFSILSHDDVAFYLRTSQYFKQFVGNNGLGESLELSTDLLTSICLQNPLMQRSLERTDLEFGIPKNPLAYLSMVNKEGVNGCGLNSDQQHVGFEVIGFDYDCYMLRPTPMSTRELAKCYEKLLSVMNSFIPLSELVQTTLFHNFETCNLNTVII